MVEVVLLKTPLYMRVDGGMRRPDSGVKDAGKTAQQGRGIRERNRTEEPVIGAGDESGRWGLRGGYQAGNFGAVGQINKSRYSGSRIDTQRHDDEL
jgi:hypothetical protein